MANRKETPDVLAEILGGEPPVETPVAKPKSKPAPKRKAASRATGRSTRRPKPSWEHMEVVYRDYGGYRARFVNGEEQDEWKNSSVIHEHLSELAAEGWELLAVGGRNNEEMPAYFRRKA